MEWAEQPENYSGETPDGLVHNIAEQQECRPMSDLEMLEANHE